MDWVLIHDVHSYMHVCSIRHWDRAFLTLIPPPLFSFTPILFPFAPFSLPSYTPLPLPSSALHDTRSKLLADVFYGSPGSTSLVENVQQENYQLEEFEMKGSAQGEGGS